MKMQPDERAVLDAFWRLQGAALSESLTPHLNARDEAKLVLYVYQCGKQEMYKLTGKIARVMLDTTFDELLQQEELVRDYLAVELHRQYRAAEKALHIGGGRLRHDHGWKGCASKAYFTQRAATIIKRATCASPSTLGMSEQGMASLVLLRRLVVDGKVKIC